MLEVGAVCTSAETVLILKSCCVVPGSLSAAGFKFQFPAMQGALAIFADKFSTPLNYKCYESANGGCPYACMPPNEKTEPRRIYDVNRECETASKNGGGVRNYPATASKFWT
jgi:hypothetical protein